MEWTFGNILLVIVLGSFLWGFLTEIVGKFISDMPGQKVIAKCIIIGAILVAIFGYDASWWWLLVAGIFLIC